MVIDKLIAFDLADAAIHDTVRMRRIFLEAMPASATNYELEQATAGLLDRYRITLAGAVRRDRGYWIAARMGLLWA